MSDTSPLIKEKAPLILAEIKKAESILLHLHPSPDPDSACSALAMKFALEQMGKTVTVIKGDSDFPEGFEHFPGAKMITQKNFMEIDLSAFDLFISLDTASKDRISMRGEVVFPPSLRVINIDHHPTNPGFGEINLVESAYPATCQILFDLFKEWNVKLTPEIAGNLFMGIYTDTGGFKFRGTDARTFRIAAELAAVAPTFPKLISDMQNSNSAGFLAFEGLALDSIEATKSGKAAISAISYEAMIERGIPTEHGSASMISGHLLSVKDWQVTAGLVEYEPNKVKVSFRSKDQDKFDVSKIASALGGGGHKAASGANLNMGIREARDTVVAKIKELYNL